MRPQKTRPMDIGEWRTTLDARGWLNACLPRPRLTLSDCQVLTRLGERLAELGYTEEAVQAWLGRPLSERRAAQAPGLAWRLERLGTPVAALAAFALLREPLSLRLAREIFGDALEMLERLHLVEREREQVLPLADLVPCQGVFAFADPRFSPIRLPNHVAEVGADSYCLARTTPRRALELALDLGTGSGVQALLAARHAHSVEGVDLNPRAIEMAEVNAVLNGLDLRCRFHQGNLFGPVQGRRFDLITANLPAVPLPGQPWDDASQRLIVELAQHLAPGGTLALYSTYPVDRRPDEVLDRIAERLGGDDGWGLAQLHYQTISREEFIEQQSVEPADFRGWMEFYEGQSIRGMGEGTLYVRRLPEGHPGFRKTLEISHPTADLSARVGDWLDALERYTDPAWEPQWSEKLRLHAGVNAVYEDLGGGMAWATFDPGWVFGQELPGAALQLVRECGVLTPAEVCERLRWGRVAMRDLLAALGEALVLSE